MGKIFNFNKFKFKPFQYRVGSIQVRNFYMDNGTPKTLQSNIETPEFSHYEIIKYEKNEYYGKIQEYLDNGYEESFGGDFLQKDGHRIQKSFFEREEICYTLAHWENVNHDELTPNLQFCGSRPLNLLATDIEIFMQLTVIGQKSIELQLKKLTEDDD